MLAVLNHPSLRRAILVTAMLVAVVALIVTAAALVTTASLRGEMERSASAFGEQQRIADRIAALTFEQQLDAYRYLQSHAQGVLSRFDDKGNQAEDEMHRYLFHSLSDSARLQVERIREAHQGFEALAHRLFELARQGDEARARERLVELDSSVARLDVAVANFLRLRVAEQRSRSTANAQRTSSVRWLVGIAGVALLLLAALLSRALTKRVLRPLEDLTATSEALRAGHAAARVPPQLYREVNAVADAYNDMAEQMQKSQEIVEMQNEELRESLDKLQDAQDELVQRERLGAMGEMLASVAHELNNPLAGVLGMAELLESELRASPDPAARELEAKSVKPLVGEARRARDLVRSLLSFARRPSEQLESVELAESVAASARLSRGAFAQARKTITIDVPSGLFVRAETQKLQQVLLNLSMNALDALREGDGSTFSIRAHAADDERVIIEATDDGPGFSNVAAAFTPFYTTKAAGHGTGLGLALVRKFVTEFGGTVDATNRVEGGAMIRISLLAAGAPAAVNRTDIVPQRELTVAAPPTRKHRILVVDDEPALRDVQRRMLELDGHEVLLASSGVNAREIIESGENIDLVISDLRMPGNFNGRALYAWLRTAHPRLAANALLVTGELAPAENDDALPRERIIVKPFTREELVSRARAALESASG